MVSTEFSFGLNSARRIDLLIRSELRSFSAPRMPGSKSMAVVGDARDALACRRRPVRYFRQFFYLLLFDIFFSFLFFFGWGGRGFSKTKKEKEKENLFFFN